eukprot:TRINITY_DN270_c0_g1_i1.p3 TRINITY_DN270_c0_g1~~TRINITY_DN270_c0_g1_i1.p3  ORF type:complete len:299 (-),score=37.22 TRINITY_DN270_c0_g1_i1:88-984(-)
MGKAIKKAGWERKDFVLSSKYILSGPGVNETFLSRKHIIEGVEGSLKRLDLDYLDIAFAHRYDHSTPIEEVCRGFNQIIDDGKAFYWGTSEWTPEQIMEACVCCERFGLIKPIVEQPEYNMCVRERFEVDLVPLYEKKGYGTVIWSPLAGGLLTGKYNKGEDPVGSRYHGEKLTTSTEWIRSRYTKGDKEGFVKKLKELEELSKMLGCTQAQLSLAWCIMNKDVSVALIGASKVEQVEENLKAIEVMSKWTPELERKLEEIMQNKPTPQIDWRYWKPLEPRRETNIDWAQTLKKQKPY